MLPKEEKINKKLDTDQPGLFDKEDEKKRLAKKRKFVYVAMFLTIGLSLSFWIYRSFKNFNFSFKLPTINFINSSPQNSPLTLSKDTSTWSIFFKKINSDLIVYQQNQEIILSDQNFETNLNELDKSNFIISSPYSSSLPEGFKIKELINENNNVFTYFSKIITPNQELLLVIKISDSKDLIQAKKSIPNLIDQLYWYSLQK